MAAPVIRFRIDFTNEAYLGPGKIALLEAIRGSGSLSGAARRLGMSYRRAWLLVESLNSSFQEPVTLATTGGRGGGGVALTKFGEELITSYRDLDRDISTVAAIHLHKIIPALAKRSTSKAASPRRSLACRRG
jgi:molybdate transport system regulatory protein